MKCILQISWKSLTIARKGVKLGLGGLVKNDCGVWSLGILVVHAYGVALTLISSKSLWVTQCPYLVSRNICAKFSKVLFTPVVKQSVYVHKPAVQVFFNTGLYGGRGGGQEVSTDFFSEAATQIHLPKFDDTLGVRINKDSILIFNFEFFRFFLLFYFL